MFTGISILAWIIPYFISALVGARFSFIFSSPGYFAEESVTGAAQKIAKVCSGFSDSEMLAPPPPRGVYIVGTNADINMQTAINVINLGRLVGGLASMVHDIRGDFAHHIEKAAEGNVEEATEGFRKSAAEVKEIVGELPKRARETPEAKKLLGLSEEIEKKADELGEIEKELSRTDDLEEQARLLEKRDELLAELQEDANEVDRILSEIESASGIEKASGVMGDLIHLDEMSEVEKAGLVKKLQKALAEQEKLLTDVSDDVLDASKKVSGFSRANVRTVELEKYSQTVDELLQKMDYMSELARVRRESQRSVEDLARAEMMVRVSMSDFTRSFEKMRDSAERMDLAVRLLKDVKEGKKFFAVPQYVKEMARFSTRTYAKAWVYADWATPKILLMIPVAPADTVDTWALGLYSKLPHYWDLLLNLNGYAYYYVPDIYIFVNSTDPAFSEIARDSISLSGNITRVQQDFVQELLEMSGDAGFYNFKETLLNNPDFSTVLVYGDDGRYHFSSYYKALLLSDYLAETCSFCDCYSHSAEADRIADEVSSALFGEDVDPDNIPVVEGCELRGDAVKKILKMSEEYEDRATELLNQFEERVVMRTKSELSSCPSFSLSVGGETYRLSECAVVIDCASSPDRCYVGVPIVGDNGLYVPVDMVSKQDASSFTSFLGKYYSPSARVSEGGAPSPTGIVICTRVETVKACRVVECGKPITYRVTPDIRARVFYDPDEDIVRIEGNVMPWGG